MSILGVRGDPAGIQATVPRTVSSSWQQTYVVAAVIADFAVGSVAATVALAGRFGSSEPPLYVIGSALFPILWVVTVAANRAYEPRFIGVGTEEFRRVLHAGVALMAFVAFVSYATKAEIARGYVLLAIPLVILLDLLARWVLRTRLYRERREGRCLQRTIVVGAPWAVRDCVAQLRHETNHGLHVVGVCLPDGAERPSGLDPSVPVVGSFGTVAQAVATVDADTVTVLSNAELSGSALRRLAWSLERTGTELVVGSGLIEVAGPRITVRPVAGLPLLHVERPRLSGAGRLTKAIYDRLFAIMALVLLAPVFLAICCWIRLHDGGPALFRQVRVGLNGKEFTLYKFRTMVTDAEKLKSDLLADNEHDGVLFKIRQDPRITAPGRVLRRWSLDELPQLLNILLGHMSLVGPRPPLPDEVAMYGDDVRRRLLVKPGLTGLWQVSGRASLSWEDSILLDLRYVENWSLPLDLHILWRTGRAVIRGVGAY
jgi:exopolysaccharide biosynthesis polyprenyl glycosylphosphotransferase